MNTQYDRLIQTIQTVTQRDYFLNDLDLLQNSLYKVTQGSTLYDLIPRYIGTQYADHLTEAMKKSGLKDGDREGFSRELTNLRTFISSLSVLQMRIPFEPKETDVSDIYSWIQFHTQKQVILDLIVDQNLIGGAVFAYKGFYKDFSLQAKIEEIMNGRI